MAKATKSKPKKKPATKKKASASNAKAKKVTGKAKPPAKGKPTGGARKSSASASRVEEAVKPRKEILLDDDQIESLPPPEKLKPLFTKQELDEIRQQLLGVLGRLRNDIEQEVKGAGQRDLAHIKEDSDIASDAAEGDLALRLAESEGVEAAEVERAIEKIDEGSYGYCDVTGKPINKERLKFLPWAIRSVEAQERYELRKKLGEDEDLDDLDVDDTGGEEE
ncbi:MAG: TraR/DksA C4-type zinc finger protein [Planctomycetes bacterium]|nr:TraR/DksA C4-type zinc finger protein [Planctomycetota bacterium]